MKFAFVTKKMRKNSVNVTAMICQLTTRDKLGVALSHIAKLKNLVYANKVKDTTAKKQKSKQHTI